jgi:hypothetical protein
LGFGLQIDISNLIIRANLSQRHFNGQGTGPPMPK